MTRLLALAILALLATVAHAQTDADLITAELDGAVVAGPFLLEVDGVDDVTQEVDLEAGTSYLLVLQTVPGRNFDPDATISGANGEIGSGMEVGEGEVISFTTDSAGPHTISVTVFGSDGPEMVGVAIYLDNE